VGRLDKCVRTLNDAIYIGMQIDGLKPEALRAGREF
jgi:hypothetical protein